ncbi:hypothetical protein OKA04_04635 [Luteolibacter flavescens]|uniref:Uncharacterized protein n=1 Tax=Luteolibacter flavescens TaxID=1859460 RepID=A0ABT3FK89_9BACT|nr:hypothetical protein [Luteolibacter flavescens]MCW1884003.1 hypothetical protein [Luteolibacter flavescens]
MSGKEILTGLRHHAAHAAEALQACAEALTGLSPEDYGDLLAELGRESAPEDQMIAGMCLAESQSRYLALTRPSDLSTHA